MEDDTKSFRLPDPMNIALFWTLPQEEQERILTNSRIWEEPEYDELCPIPPLALSVQDYWRLTLSAREQKRLYVRAADLEAEAEQKQMIVYKGKIISPRDYPCSCKLLLSDDCYQDRTAAGKFLSPKEHEESECHCPCHSYEWQWD